MEALTNIQYELFMVLSTVCYFKYDTLTCHCFKSMKAKTTDAVMTDMSGSLLSSCTEHFVITWVMQWALRILFFFYFFTSWITSSSSITWSLPTFWGLCFTEEPQTSALKERVKKRKKKKEFDPGWLMIRSRVWKEKISGHYKVARQIILCYSSIIKEPTGYVTSLRSKSFHVSQFYPSVPLRMTNAQQH